MGNLMEALAGMIALSMISVIVISTIKPVRDNRILVGSLLMVVLVMHGLSITNAYIFALPGSEADAKLFNQYAVEFLRKGNWPELSIGTEVYLFILTGFYRLFGVSLDMSDYMLIGQSLSIVAATVTLVFVDRIALCMGVADVRWRAGVVLVTGFLPLFLLHNVLTFREPYQLLGLLVGVYCVLKGMDDGRARWLLGAVTGLAFMGAFHHVLLGVSFVLIGGAVIFIYGRRSVDRWGYSIVAILVLVVGVLGYLVLTNVPATKGNDYVKDVREKGGIIEAIKEYRSEVEGAEPRTSYSVPIDSATLLRTATGLATNYWLYLTEPLWRMPERTADLVPQACSGLRLAMLGVIVWFLVFRSGAHPKLFFLVLTYVVITTVWSLGTTNYGQAFRHHSLSDWLLILMVAYIFRCGRGYLRFPKSEKYV